LGIQDQDISLDSCTAKAHGGDQAEIVYDGLVPPEMEM
jgi:hypothetical protein